MSRISVLGSGAWGTAMALSLAAKGIHQVTLWSHRTEEAELLDRRRENARFLPGYRFPVGLKITGDDKTAIAGAEVLVLVVPSEFLRATMERIAPWIEPRQRIASATKGIEDFSCLRMTQVIESCLPARLVQSEGRPTIGSLSGPSFAQEVAAGMPTAVTIAFVDQRSAQFVQQEFSSDTLRLYTNEDVIGVELGGALKNVIAIAAGVLAGLGMGSNSAAGLITRGIAEMTRLAVAAGGRRETLRGLSGVGDLVLTCTGSLSRNRTVGLELGRGRKLAEILAGLDGKVAEGVRTTRAANRLAKKLGVEMPITWQMEQILDQGKQPKEAIRELMQRPGRHEED